MPTSHDDMRHAVSSRAASHPTVTGASAERQICARTTRYGGLPEWTGVGMDSITDALGVFRASSYRFVAALADVPETTWVFKSSPSVWSMAEVIEHVTMTDRGIRSLASRALRPFEAGEHSAVDDAAIATIFDGDGPPPPGTQEPTGSWTDREAALGEFVDASNALAAWFERQRRRPSRTDLRAPPLRPTRRCAVAAVCGVAPRQPHPRSAGVARTGECCVGTTARTRAQLTAPCAARLAPSGSYGRYHATAASRCERR